MPGEARRSFQTRVTRSTDWLLLLDAHHKKGTRCSFEQLALLGSTRGLRSAQGDEIVAPNLAHHLPSTREPPGHQRAMAGRIRVGRVLFPAQHDRPLA